PGWIYQGNLNHVMGNLMLNVKLTASSGGFGLDPRGSDINPDTGHNEGNDWLFFFNSSVGRYYGGSLYDYSTYRNSHSLSLAGNYFAEGILGADHEIRFGVDYYTSGTTSQTLYPNQRITAFHNRETHSWPEVWMIPDTYFDVSLDAISFYLSDTASFGRLTVNIGIRYDKESPKLNGSKQKAFTWYEPGTIYHGTTPPIVAHDLRALDLAPKDPGVFLSTISPRAAFTYDISGDGKNVVKLSASRYGSPGGYNLAVRLFHYREIQFPWNDINGDEVPNYNEIDWNNSFWNNLMFADTDGYRNVSYDPDYNTDLLDEYTISFEKEIFEDFGVSITGFYKKIHNLSTTLGVMPDGTIETKDNWYEYDIFTFDNGDIVPVYGQKVNPIGEYYTNYTKTYDSYTAIQLILSKKLSRKWMLDASFTYMDWKRHLDASETLNMNNFDFLNEGVVASGRGVNSRWQAKLSGLAQLPWGLNFTGVFQAREGYVIAYRDYTPVLDSNPHWQVVYHSTKPTNKMGDDRLPAFWMLNLGLEKSFKISDTAAVTLFVDGYNITNNTSTLQVNDIDGSSVDVIQRVLNPGIFQFGVRVKF
ncbi:MAG: hypothetical protein KAS29_16665, partial [Bacteroidales bacterium]|nr:hypothetical protein [Bacteroidales bacterium]